MPQDIKTFSFGSVNSYLVRTNSEFLLIDTGLPTKRIETEKELDAAGCQKGNLKLIVLSHGDYDHAGNAAYFGKKYGAKTAMHHDDSERVERGDWKWGFKAKPDKFPLMYRAISLFIKAGPFDAFKPDVYLENGQNLSEYGCQARVLHLPGHTRGSIGILTTDGDLFCGDLMDNMRKPSLEFFIDDMAAAKASIEKLRTLKVVTVYPGHGRPFPWEEFLKTYR